MQSVQRLQLPTGEQDFACSAVIFIGGIHGEPHSRSLLAANHGHHVFDGSACNGLSRLCAISHREDAVAFVDELARVGGRVGQEFADEKLPFLRLSAMVCVSLGCGVFRDFAICGGEFVQWVIEGAAVGAFEVSDAVAHGDEGGQDFAGVGIC